MGSEPRSTDPTSRSCRVEAAVGETVQCIRVVTGRVDGIMGVGLAATLAFDARIVVLASGVGQDALPRVASDHSPDAIVVDLSHVSDAEQIERLAMASPQTGVVVLAHALSPRERERLLEAGVMACVSHQVAPEALLATVHHAAAGEHRSHLVAPLAAAIHAAALTPREREVCDWKLIGRTDQQIAAALSISVATVRKHVQHMYRKLGVSDRNELRALGLLNKSS